MSRVYEIVCGPESRREKKRRQFQHEPELAARSGFEFVVRSTVPGPSTCNA